MAVQNKRGMVETRWRGLQPAWGPKKHEGERRALYELLSDDETIDALVGCVGLPDIAFRANANRWDRMRNYDSIAVQTGRRSRLAQEDGHEQGR